MKAEHYALSNEFDLYDGEVTGMVYHPQNLIFEGGHVKHFKHGNAVLGQKIIAIGCLNDFCFCLNITSSIDGYVVQLKKTGQLFELSYRQAGELYRAPKSKSFIRLDKVHVFRDIHSFETISFADELYTAFSRVSHLVLVNPMNLKDASDLRSLPLKMVEKFCDISKVKLIDKFGITYEELIALAG